MNKWILVASVYRCGQKERGLCPSFQGQGDEGSIGGGASRMPGSWEGTQEALVFSWVEGDLGESHPFIQHPEDTGDLARS